MLNFRPGMWKCPESCSQGIFSPIRNERRPQLLWESVLLRTPTQFCRPQRSEQSQIRSGWTTIPLSAVYAKWDVRFLIPVFKISVMFNLWHSPEEKDRGEAHLLGLSALMKGFKISPASKAWLQKTGWICWASFHTGQGCGIWECDVLRGLGDAWAAI